MTERKISIFKNFLNSSPTIIWYSIWKYLSDWEDSTERDEAVQLAEEYFKQQCESLNLGLATTLLEKRLRCESLLFITENLKGTEVIGQYLPDILAAFLLYEDYSYYYNSPSQYFNNETLTLTNAVKIHEKLEVLLQNCATTELFKASKSIYAQRQNDYLCSEDIPYDPHDDNYWMNCFIQFSEINKNAFGYASLLWSEDAVDFCLQKTTLTLDKICRSLLYFEDGKSTLKLSTHVDLEQLPIGVGKLNNLGSLYLYLSGIKFLSTDIGQLSNLEFLYLSIDKLICLPEELSNLKCLKKLVLENMYFLEELPNNFYNLAALEELSLNYCGFCNIPEPIFQLIKLKTLTIRISSSVKNNFIISPKICQLHNLEELNIIGKNVNYLPNEIGNLLSLKKLSLNCYDLNNLPDSIVNLTNLNKLSIIGSANINSLPENLNKLVNLQSLSLANLKTANIPKVLFKMTFLQNLFLECNAPEEEIEQLKHSLSNTKMNINKLSN